MNALDENFSEGKELLEILTVQGARLVLKINFKKIDSARPGINEGGGMGRRGGGVKSNALKRTGSRRSLHSWVDLSWLGAALIGQ